MTEPFWLALLFAVVVYIGLWAFGRWVMPRLNLTMSSLEMKALRLESTVADLQRRLNESEEQNRRLEERTEFLLDELRKSNAEIERQKRQINELTSKVKDLQRDVSNMPNNSSFRVLGIWPDGTPILDQQSEANALYDAGFEYKALRGPEANRSGILRELERYKPLIWEIGAHGDENGILLSDGVARPGWWGNLAKQYRPPIAAVLMACRSNQQDRINVADALISAGVKNVIACDKNILDADATKFVSLFYERLAAGANFKDAADRAKLAVSDASREMITVRVGETYEHR